MRTLGSFLTGIILAFGALMPVLLWFSSLVLGLWISGWAFTQLLLNQASASWPTTTAVIQSATVTTSPGRFGTTNYWPDITYTYSAEQRTYAGTTIIFGQSGPATQTYAIGKVAQYAPGATVAVAYDPADPQRAALEPGGLISQTYVGLGLGVLFCGCGCWGLVARLRPPKRRYFQP